MFRTCAPRVGNACPGIDGWVLALCVRSGLDFAAKRCAQDVADAEAAGHDSSKDWCFEEQHVELADDLLKEHWLEEERVRRLRRRAARIWESQC